MGLLRHLQWKKGFQHLKKPLKNNFLSKLPGSLIITNNDHRPIHLILKLMHHVWNDIALIYHKIYETCTFFLMSFMQILLHPLFAPLKKKKFPHRSCSVKKPHSLLLISVLLSSSSQQEGEGEELAPAWM